MDLILGITTIGDLLLNNKITKDNTGKEINNITLKIPNYQRPYKWQVKNANQLLDDILDAKANNKEVYRVGTLILHKNNGNYDIVDGQQRVITFSLLLYALNEDKIDFLSEQLPNNEFNNRNIINNYNAFKRRISNIKDNHEEQQNLLNYIKNNCELIIVITNDLTEAFQFFDSQNARGKKLFPHDLLKAYHLREMNNVQTEDIEKIVKIWEDLDQNKLSSLFKDYLYRLKEWIKGNRADDLNENNIGMFKGINQSDNFPYAQYYKGAFSYADMINQSSLPFVTGLNKMSTFQIDTPIVAGKPFFEYAKHYFDILSDIQNNDKYEGCFINDNAIIETLNQRKYRNGVGNRITRLLLDTSILLYVDRFCSEKPQKEDLALLDQFVTLAFIWAYSLRAQYINLGWLSAQNYILGLSNNIKNSFNIYKMITEADSPNVLLNNLSDSMEQLEISKLPANKQENIDEQENGVFVNYLYYFKKNDFLKEQSNEK